ncbi:sodium-extruding oxaloacetate decarboxylase subunit alpha [Methanocaldococcus indicus]|uniref:sodium-extruding oxaloacetate decarboxylase subunit alpha n=1 Tax=Methanocaldococcus indicus TaxID=213231 RepID=UPI003C6D3613
MVKITDVTFRDAQQSLMATRLRTEDMLPIAEKMDEVGFYSMEVWGGATFDVCIRYLNEDPWERLRALKSKIKETPLEMLLRGQNLVGYRHYPDDIVEKFIEKAVENGIDIFRIFDALNDIRNMETAIKTAKKLGAEVHGCICYTISPVHTVEKFVEFAKELANLEVDVIDIKDMAGLLTPYETEKLIKALKKEVGLPIKFHSHCTCGLAPLSLMKAIESGVDIVHTAISPLSMGTSHFPTESLVAALKGTKYDTNLDLDLLLEIRDYFLKIREKYKALIPDHALIPDAKALYYQIPGGMLTNLISQLKEQGALDKLNEVLEEVPRVRKDLGYPPLVTPISQIVGTQAVMNVLTGERYKIITNEVAQYVKGLYGKPPAPISKELLKRVLDEDEKPITCRPADLLEPEWEKVKEEAEKLGIVKKEEDILTYALFPQIAVKFLRGELKAEPIPQPKKIEKILDIPTEYIVEVDGERFEVKIEPKIGTELKRKREVIKADIEGAVTSPVKGMITKIKVKEGDTVKKGDIIAIVEAMKMEHPIESPRDGIVEKILIEEGETVNIGDVIMIIK